MNKKATAYKCLRNAAVSLFAVAFGVTIVAPPALAVTGYLNSAGVDVETLFEPGNSGITTGYKTSAGTDLGSLFLDAASGSPGPTTGYKLSDGRDIGPLFCAKGTKKPTTTTIAQCICAGISDVDGVDFTLRDTTIGKTYTSMSGSEVWCIDSTGMATSLVAGHSYSIQILNGSMYGWVDVYHNGARVVQLSGNASYSFTCENPAAWRIEATSAGACYMYYGL